AFPAGVQKYGELLRIETEGGARHARSIIAGKRELWMHGHARDLDALGRDAVIDQLLPRLFARHEIQPDIVAGPPLPESVVRIGDDGNERNAISQSQLFEYPREHVLRQRMDTHYHVRTPLLKLAGDITHRS